ncbi:uncharacterized protein A4U43_C03F6110 [Asparagus officinalis]|uniref:Uncharacterized protein n=2 Tax=Asparagus officinalis TaxID=4686 RepID=A0A5P1F7S9_ASPOF|nr:uncharacterized protein A4U43_C03F6110 [Asparagus officinalis]
MSRQPPDVLPAYSTVNSSEVDPLGLSIGHNIDTGENGNVSETIPGTSRCSMNIAKDMNQSSLTDSKVSECFDEDVPLISWMRSLAVAAKSKRSSNKSSSEPG